MIKAVDLSKNNTVTDYSALKNNIDAAIIKIIRKDGNLEEDYWKHLNGCRQANIPVIGVYNYSYATSADKAAYDAGLVVSYMKASNLWCAVWLDLEDKVVKGLGHKLIDIINEYKKVICLNGYPFGIYCGQSYYNQYLKPYANEISNVPIWIARYYANDKVFTSNTPVDESKLPMIPNVVMWQYTSHGVINGINGNVDINNVYYDAISQVQSTPEVPVEQKEDYKELYEKVNKEYEELKNRYEKIKQRYNETVKEFNTLLLMQ